VYPEVNDAGQQRVSGLPRIQCPLCVEFRSWLRVKETDTAPLSRVVECLELRMYAVTQVASVPLPGGQKRSGLLRRFCVHTPFLAA